MTKRILLSLALILVASLSCSEALSMKLCIGTFLNPTDMELCPFGQSIHIQSALLGQSSEAAVPGDACPTNDTDCTLDLGANRPNDVQTLINYCEGRIVCDTFVATGDPLTCDGFAVSPTYLIFEYQCIVSSTQLEYSVTCQGQQITGLTCPQDYGIKLGQVLYADTGTGGCEDHDTVDYQCMVNITQQDPDFYQEIFQGCDSQESCSGVTAKSFSVGNCGDLTGVNTNNVVIGYSCVPIIQTVAKCVLESFDDALTCADGYIIDIISAYYSDDPAASLTPEQCANLQHTNSCLSDISIRKPSYYQEILDKCEDKPACEGLFADSRGPLGACNPNQRPDHIRIYYLCIEDLSNVTTAAPAPTTTGAPPAETTTVQAQATTTQAPPAETTTVQAGVTSTQASPGQTTTVQAGVTSTQAPPGQTTTVQAGVTSTQAPPGQTTTVQAGVTTTQAPPGETTTQAPPGETTTVDTRGPTAGTDRTTTATAPPRTTTVLPGTTTTPPPPPPPPGPDGPPENLILIIGLTVGAIPVLGIIIAIIYYCCKRNPSQNSSRGSRGKQNDIIFEYPATSGFRY